MCFVTMIFNGNVIIRNAREGSGIFVKGQVPVLSLIWALSRSQRHNPKMLRSVCVCVCACVCMRVCVCVCVCVICCPVVQR